MTMPHLVSSSVTTAALVLVVAAAPALGGQPAAASSPAAAPAAQPAPPASPPRPAALTVPPGFSVSVFASGLPGARLMAVSPEGIVVVAKRADVVALPDADGDGRAEPRVLLAGLTYAHSLAFRDGYLYIGTTPAVLRVKWSQGEVAGPLETYVELPSSKPAMHTSRSIAFGPDGRLYVSIGSSCNVCLEGDLRRTTIQVFDGPGSKGRTFASGLRNAVGFDWDPASGQMWSTDTGQERLGDDSPPDEINLIHDGQHYGFPYFHGKNVPSTVPELKEAPRTPTAAQVEAPVFELPPHASPLGLAFYRGTRFPAEFSNSLYVASHGSTERSSKVGYSVVRLVMKDGRPVASEDFVTGWLNDGAVTGRPAGLVTGADGALYISDDNKGYIYQVKARTRPAGAGSKILVTHEGPLASGGRVQMQVSEVSYEPGGWSTPHQHPCPVVVYVLDGAIRSQLAGQEPRVYHAGETFTELPTDQHVVSENASDTAPARFLAYVACSPPTRP